MVESQHPDIDPLSMQLAQELYDPAGRLTDPEMAPYRVEFAKFILKIYGVEAPSERLLPALFCDAVESGVDGEGLLERAGSFGAKDSIVASLRIVTEQVRQQAEDILKDMGSNELAPGISTLAAADFIARAAYAGKQRRTGAPYYNHPQQAAAMMLHIFDVLEEEGYAIERPFKDAVLSTELLHDATEETVRSCRYYDPDRPQVFSPLLVRKVFDLTGNPYGRAVANSLRLMTHYAQHPWAPTYQRYISLGSSDFIFCLAKACDMWHNLHIEPKPATTIADARKIRTKQALYRAGIELLSIAAPQYSDNRHNMTWVSRYFDILQGIEPEDIPAMVDTLETYIHGAQNEPLAPLARKWDSALVTPPSTGLRAA